MLDIEEYILHAEVTLSHLQKNGDAGFLRLVKAYFIPDTTRIPDKPIFLPYPAWDKYPTKDEKYREAQTYVETLRNYFICQFFESTLYLLTLHRPFLMEHALVIIR
jgi:hypothetical protein